MSTFRPNWDKAQALDTLETVTKQMAVAVTRCSRDLRYLWANQAYASWIQRPLNEIVGHQILEVLGKDAFEALLPYFNQVLSGETVRYEQETNFQGVGPRWTSATYSPTLDANGVTNGWVAVVVDITERRMAEQVLRESEERFRFAAQAGRMFAYSWDAATDVIERSGQSATILGIDEAAPLTGHQAISKVHPDDREGLLAAMAGLAPEKPFLQVTYRIVRPDESVIWVERHSRAYFDEHGKIKRIVGMIIDITERKPAEVALLRHAAIVESSDDAIVGTDVSGTVTDWNKAAERLYGYLASEAIGKNISFLRAPDRSEEGQANLKKIMKGDVVKPYETVCQRKDGTRVEISLTVSPIIDAEGRIVGASGISRDITERKQSEKALRESEERFRGLYENSTLGLYRTTPDGKILLANPSLVKMLGFSSFSELAQRNLEEEGFEPSYERAEFQHRLATEGEIKGLEASWTRRDGTAIFVRESAKAVRDAEGKTAYYEGTVEDITECRRAEEALRQSEEKFLKAFRGSPVAITLSRVKDRRFIEVNDTFECLFGYRREEAIGRTASDLGLWVDPSQWEELRNQLLSGQSHRDLELRFRTKNGRVLTCLVAAELIEVAKEPCVLSVASDITERKLAEDRLREYEKAVEGLEEMVVVVDRQYRYLIANRKFLNLRNMTKEQVEGRFANEVLNKGVFETVVKEKLDECFRGNVVRFEMKYTYPELGERDISVSYFPIEGAAGVDRAACIFQDVTERKQMEEALKKSEEKFSKAFRESPLVVAITRMRDHRYLDVSESFEQWIGWRREEVIGRTPLDIGIWVDPAERSEFVKRLMAEGVVRNLEFRYRRKDGVEMVGLGSGELIEIANEQCVISVITDITERKLAEERVRVSEERLRLAQWAARIGTFDLNLRTGVDNWTPETEALYGLPAGGFGGTLTAFENLIHPDDREKIIELTKELMRTGRPAEAEFRVVWSDGSVHWVAARAQVLMDESGEPSRMLGVNIDITERKRAEQELAIASERLHLAINSGSVGGWDYNLKTGKKVWFGKTNAQLGMAPDESPGSFEESWDRIHKDDREHLQHALRVARDKHEQFTEEFRVVWQDGTTRWVRSQGRYFYAANGEPERLLGLSVDITQRKLAEEALQESEQRFRLVANTAPVMIWMSGLDKKPTYFNQLWLDFTGLSETDLQNGLAGIVHPEDYPQSQEVYCRGFDQRQPFRKECRLRRHDGEYRWILDIGVPRFHKDGSFAGYIGSCIDVTERKRAEEALSGMTRKLVEAQEQERARIARELHDDINQRIALLAIELDQLREKHKDLPSKVRGHVQKLRRITADMASRVYALSHELYSSIPDSLGLAKGMRSWCREFGKQKKMEIDFKSHDLPRLPQEISLCLFRVLQEAVHNAAKHSGVKRVDVQLAENSGEIHLIVSDSGKGFDIEAARRSGGLGLMSMQERVRLVGGTIAIESKPMGGTAIRVRVPTESKQLSQRATVE